RRRHTRWPRDWSSDVCSSDLWEGSFDEYLDIVREHPEVTRSAYQRLYDMILSHGTEEVFETKEKVIRYKFFADFAAQHGDGIYGLERQIMHLVNAFKSAAKGYGTERRVLLLHGPVGSSKSTIARLLKKGLEPNDRRGQGLPPDSLRARPHRHRHIPAQGRKEPGLDGADRRHQLPQDRGIRHRQRSTLLQLRR